MRLTKPRRVGSRDEKYMSLALYIAKIFSKDPHTQIGAVIVSKDNRPLGFGYNGAPRTVDDLKIDWGRPSKYRLMVHAEINAIAHTNEPLTDATLYVTAMPCPRCMLEIAAYGVRKVVYYDMKTGEGSSINNDSAKESCMNARDCKITLKKFVGELIDVHL